MHARTQVCKGRETLKHDSAQLPTRFDARGRESDIYAFWEQGGHFAPPSDPGRKPFVIVIPPPNVTGSLHMGHALNNTIQDLLIRWQRMSGRATLWVPGTDHAGIATQFVVEKELKKEKLSRLRLGRDEFIKRVWDWKRRYGDTIIGQLKRLGCACDWSRTRFTMDEGYARAVLEEFVRLYQDGLIYRGKRIINWCPRCLTALSDLEVEYEEKKGSLWYIKYPFQGGGGHVTVATTRPETMLGDTALAVNPADPRYSSLREKTAILPLMDRPIPLVPDEVVDMKFGTGALKVTPGHDVNDYEIARRHGLPVMVCIEPNGTMSAAAGRYAGMDRFKCREAIVHDLEKLGLLDKIEPYDLPLAKCYRCHTALEPYLSEQWFAKMKPLAEPAIEVVKSGKVRFVPERWAKVYLDWMENIRDWCISRQIWWGHRIPVWYCEKMRNEKCKAQKGVIASLDAPAKCPHCGASELHRDEDVLDTWFSSALWPFATLGWPEKTADLKRFYPTSVLVTDRGIIALWVARMIMTGLRFMGQVPFTDVLIHPTIQNPEGKRMSKSLGTGIDPLELVERYGADGTRFGLLAQMKQAQDMRFSPKRLEAARNLVTKLWNAVRFAIGSTAESSDGIKNKSGPESKTLNAKRETRNAELVMVFEDRWILSRLNTVIADYTAALGEYRFGDAAELLQGFFWHEVCDWYIEIVKDRGAGGQSLLLHVLKTVLKLFHPMMPFVTEELWQHLAAAGGAKASSREGEALFTPLRAGSTEPCRHRASCPPASAPESIMEAAWPVSRADCIDRSVEATMEVLMRIVRGVRDIRSKMDIARSQQLEALLSVLDDSLRTAVADHSRLVVKLAGLSRLAAAENTQRPPMSATEVIGSIQLFVPLQGIIDKEAERARIMSRKDKCEAQLAEVKKKLGDAKFVERAPEEVVEREQEHKAELEENLARLKSALAEIETWGNL
jgi:valyl-tRNA synthetase